MKKTFLLLLLLPLLTIACSDDKEELIDYERISGTWIYSKHTAKASIKNDKDNRLTKTIEDLLYDIPTSSIEWGYKFNTDNTYDELYDGASYSGTYTLKGRTITMKYEGIYDPKTYGIAFSGDDILLSVDITENIKEALKEGAFNSLLKEGESFDNVTIRQVISTDHYTKR